MVDLVDSFDGFAIFSARTSVGLQLIDDVDAFEDQHLVLDLDLAAHLGGQPALAGIDVARLQRTCQGAGESAACGGDQVIDRRGVRRRDLWADAVVLGDGAVHAERHGARLGGQISKSQRPDLSFDSDLGDVGDVGHG